MCSTQRSLVHRMGMHGVSNRHTHLYPPHNNSTVHLKTTYVGALGRSPMECGVVGQHYETRYYHPRHRPTWNDPAKNSQPESGLTASAPRPDISAPVCTNEVWSPLRLVSVAQKNKLSTMLSSQCPINRPLHGLQGLTVLNDETIEWLHSTALELPDHLKFFQRYFVVL